MSYGQYPQYPRRLPEAVYWRRRAVAFVVVLALVVGLYKIVSAMFSGTPSTIASTPSTGAPVTVTSAQAPTTLPGDTLPPPASTTSTTTPPREPRQISAESPAVVYIAGDSDAGAIGPYLSQLVELTGMASATLDYHNSTGLSRPDFFDWGAQLNQQIPALNPDIVVFAIGGNDAQGLLDLNGTVLAGVPTGEQGGDQEWRAEYGRRVGATMDYLTAGGRTLIWVGIPNAEGEDFNRRLRVQDDVVKAEAARRERVVYVDTWARFSGINGGFAEFVIDPRDGVGKDVRSKVDNWHLNENGAEILALDILTAIVTEMRTRGAPI